MSSIQRGYWIKGFLAGSLILAILTISFKAEAWTYKERVKNFKEIEWGLFPKKVLGIFKVTAYDLSIESCGKSRNHPLYGYTASGICIANKSRFEARTIAVDPKVIPLGSFVFIQFYEERALLYSDFYVARDTGSKIKGSRIDVYLGEDVGEECREFGVTEAKVYLLKLDGAEAHE